MFCCLVLVKVDVQSKVQLVLVDFALSFGGCLHGPIGLGVGQLDDRIAGSNPVQRIFLCWFELSISGYLDLERDLFGDFRSICVSFGEELRCSRFRRFC